MKKSMINFISIIALVFTGFITWSCQKDEANVGTKTKDLKPSESRKIASANQEQQTILDDITEKVIAIKSADEIKPLAKSLIDDYSKIAEEKKFYAVQLYLYIAGSVKHVESIFWRLRAIAEHSDLVHVNSLLTLRKFQQKDYLYGSHVQALFDFMTRPSSELKMFKNLDEFQNTINVFTRVLQRFDNKLEEVYNNVPASQLEFVIDRRLVIGGGDGSDPDELRYLDKDEMRKTFIKPYIRGIQFITQRYIAWGKIISLLELNELPVILKSLVVKSAINSTKGRLTTFVFGKEKKVAKGLSSQIIFETIKQKTSNFGKIKSSIKVTAAQKRLDVAREYFAKAATNYLEMYVCGITYPIMLRDDRDYDSTDCSSFPSFISDDSHVNESYAKTFILNANFMLVDRKNKYHDFRQLADLFNSQGVHTIHSKVTGQDVEINLDEIFKYRESFRDFLPVAYDTGSHGLKDEATKKWKWNYNWGRPTAWKNGVWSKMFPQVDGNGSGRGERSVHRLLTNLEYTDALVPFASLISTP